jgi:hypothetical protein
VTIFDAVLAARNLGWKKVDVQELKEALLPPNECPHR